MGNGESMQIVGPLGSAIAMYSYYDKSYYEGATANYWGDDDLNPVNVSFDKGDGIALDNMNEMTFKVVGSGEVIKDNVKFAASSNLNWSGNPFAQEIDINDIQLTDEAGLVGNGESMQIVGPLGSAKAMYSFYDKSYYEGATANYWGDDDLNPVDVKLQPGDGFAIDNMNDMTFDITIKCPFSL